MNIDDRIQFYNEKVENLKGRLGKKSFRHPRSDTYLKGEIDELEQCIMQRERLKFQRDREVNDEQRNKG